MNKALVEEYIIAVMKKGFSMSIFLEKDIQTSGKIGQPKNSIFDIMVKSFLSGRTDLEDIKIVPVTMNYEKILEGASFPYAH